MSAAISTLTYPLNNAPRPFLITMPHRLSGHTSGWQWSCAGRRISQLASSGREACWQTGPFSSVPLGERGRGGEGEGHGTENVTHHTAIHERGITLLFMNRAPHELFKNTPHPHLACTSLTWHGKPARQGICRRKGGEWGGSLHFSAAVQVEGEGGDLHSCSHLRHDQI